METYKKYRSALGYVPAEDSSIDSYGVDHSGFTTQDEVAYQNARVNRENELINRYNQQGINENYPQHGVGFWGNATNNYGFGHSNIGGNIENHPVFATTPVPLQPEQNGYNRRWLKDPNCYMTFNGQNLELYNNTGKVGSLDAQSGRDEYQSSQYQNVDNKGPIPEGIYYANQNQRQNITFADALIGTGVKVLNGIGVPINRGKWKGGPISWGTKRVWLQPDVNTHTYGRSGFTIHGGLSKGSAGCIDIPWQTGRLSNYLDDCQDSVPVYVKYPKNW